MKINLKRLNNEYHFETTNEFGEVVYLDNKQVPHPKGSSPMDLLLRAIAGCSSIDIIHILKKQHIQLESIEMNVEGFRNKEVVPSLFDKIHLDIHIKGNASPIKILRAIDLSLQKYCSVAKILEKSATIDYRVYLNKKSLTLKQPI